ncbi:hypothetical protein [Dysgonomonas sp.]|jgi:hypothetical protein|nr:hypothetical protein [Prevotella sp.]
MKIALFLKEDKIDDVEKDSIPIIVLHTNENSVVEVEKDMLVKKDINYIALWLLTKRIKEIYVMDINLMVKRLFENLGVIVKKYEDIEKDSLLKRFMS